MPIVLNSIMKIEFKNTQTVESTVYENRHLTSIHILVINLKTFLFSSHGSKKKGNNEAKDYLRKMIDINGQQQLFDQLRKQHKILERNTKKKKKNFLLMRYETNINYLH